jgi:alpha-beta hydrolase superfamily lysophospholipase
VRVPTQRRVSVPSGALVVHVWPPPGPPEAVVMLAHGYAEHALRHSHVAERLTELNALVAAPDQRGHGQSAGVRGLMSDLDDYADDLAAIAALIEADHPKVPQVLVGHSMGGNIAARFVQLHHGTRLRALVLSGPVLGGNPEVFALADHEPIPNVPVDPGVLSRDSSVGVAFAADPLVYHGPYRRRTIEAYRESVARIASGGSLGPVPTLWIHGENDQLAPLNLTRAAIERVKGPDFQEIVYQGARHEIFNETNREQVIADLLSFLSKALSADGH